MPFILFNGISFGKIIKNCRKIWGGKMWCEDVVCKLNKEQVYTRQQIYEALVDEKPELTYNSFKWIISKMVDNGIISRKQRGEYVLQSNPISEKQIYKPLMNVQLQEISEKIEVNYHISLKMLRNHI
ncbi:hypothetical protein BRYFOR_06778 [Marvinbryantia formatexigens DSM 14469]|uniref:Uncharacterized protein n=2 Tax=Marvinbryantia TaxID=248744 RepID=C6LDS9_9FIRM|nr:hypothetical protein [Marvinbryantia formatexigens]EET61133.1 hypothetical protein BRYFOR_06778 [Marvinbryantia formatexigens DSM 14469]